MMNGVSKGSRWKPVSQKAIEVVEGKTILAYTGKVVGMVRLDKIRDVSEGCWVGCSMCERGLKDDSKVLVGTIETMELCWNR